MFTYMSKIIQGNDADTFTISAYILADVRYKVSIDTLDETCGHCGQQYLTSQREKHLLLCPKLNEQLDFCFVLPAHYFRPFGLRRM